MTLYFIILFAKASYRTQGNTFTSLSKDMIKETDEQPNEEAHGVMSGWVLSPRNSILWCWVGSPSCCECVHPPGSCANPYYLYFVKASSHRHDHHHLHFQPLCSLWRMGRGAENSKLLITAWSLWWPAPTWRPTRVILLEQ